MHLPDGRWSEAGLIDQPEVQIVEVARADHVSGPVAECGEDVVVEQLSVSAQRRWAEVGARQHQPPIRHVGECRIRSDVSPLVELGCQSVEHLLGIPLRASHGPADLPPAT